MSRHAFDLDYRPIHVRCKDVVGCKEPCHASWKEQKDDYYHRHGP